MATSPSRRRERSVRVTAASLLLALAAVFVTAAILSGALVWLSAASAFSVVTGLVVAWLDRAELLASRRETGAVRADLAAEYRDILEVRGEEHAVFLHALTDQLVFRERELSEMEGVVALAERRAEVAEEQRSETERALREVQAQLPQQYVGSADDDSLETVVDLLGWGRTSTADQLEIRRHA
jgi:hypothetical protein